MNVLTLPAPAKLNLFLHVLGRRADGYHLLQTVFQLLDYGDELQFRRRDDDAITLNADLPGVASDDNLVMRAARLLRQYAGTRAGADIALIKRLPAGGGLGGGSSDAATTLLALNHLWQLGLSVDQLAELGLQLGADVPVFVRGHSAWGEGVGEQLRPVDLPEVWFVVLTPPCSVNTGEIFASEQLTRNTLAITMSAFLQGGGHNDCQPVVVSKYPDVRMALEWLAGYALSRMTGTGASVFAGFSTRDEAEAVLAKKPAAMRGFVARAVNVSPLHETLAKQAGT